MKVCTIEAPMERSRPLTFLLGSDVHFGSPGLDQRAWGRFLAEAEKLDTFVLLNGDLFDAIFPTDRKRFTIASSSISQDGAINQIMEEAEAFFLPLADKLAWVGYGNHETACIKFNNFDPIQDLVSRLGRHRNKALPPIQRGDYKSFIRLAFVSEKAKKYRAIRHGKSGGASTRFVIFADHGTGGAPEVTKGTINLERLYATYDANLYWMGHVHKAVYDATRHTVGLGHMGQIVHKKKHGLVTGTFLKSMSIHESEAAYRLNYGEERHSGVQSTGYARLRVWFEGSGPSLHFEINQVTEE